MIKIPEISQDNINAFYKETHDLFLDFLNKYKYSDKYKKIIDYFLNDSSNTFDEIKIKKVLIGGRNDLLDTINHIGTIPNDVEISDLYETFRETPLAKKWPSLIGLKVCPYCNRVYITHEHDFEYDHYYCKSKYPYLGISMRNLIPCCRACNRDKSTLDTFATPFIYPFEQEFGYEIIFDVQQNGGVFQSNSSIANYSINIRSSSGVELPDYIQKEIDQLELISKYLSHEGEIDYIFNQINEKLPQRAESIEKTFGMSFDKTSIWNYCDKDCWHQKILSKFTYDIVEQYSK